MALFQPVVAVGVFLALSVIEQHKNGNFTNSYGNILQTLTVVGVALGGMYAGIILPIHQEIGELSHTVDKNSTEDMGNIEKVSNFFISELKEKLAKDEHLEFKLREDKQIETLRAELSTAKSEIDYLRDNQVTRAEHVTHWDQTKENITTALKQVEDLRRDFGGQYTIAEKLKDLQGQLDQLRHPAASPGKQ